MDKMKPGEAVIIFTPDSASTTLSVRLVFGLISLAGTHYPIAKYALERKLHVLVTKPATQLLSHHIDLIELAEKKGVICFVEHHKRCV